MSASEATLAAALQQLMRDWDIYDALTLQAVLENDAGFARALAPALWLLLQEAGPSRSSTGTMTDGVAVVEAGVQTCLTGNVVDTSTAEAMVAEATCMLDDADERAQLAEAHSRAWQDRAELASSLLKAEENRTDRARAQKLEAESWAAAERDARQVIQQLLAAEAAVADAAEERAMHEHKARCQAEAQRDIWQALAGGRGSQGGRGGRGHVPPPPAPPPPPPPPPPPLPELIRMVLAVPIANEGQMSEEEARAILNVTEQRPNWLRLQVHPGSVLIRKNI